MAQGLFSGLLPVVPLGIVLGVQEATVPLAFDFPFEPRGEFDRVIASIGPGVGDEEIETEQRAEQLLSGRSLAEIQGGCLVRYLFPCWSAIVGHERFPLPISFAVRWTPYNEDGHFGVTETMPSQIGTEQVRLQRR